MTLEISSQKTKSTFSRKLVGFLVLFGFALTLGLGYLLAIIPERNAERQKQAKCDELAASYDMARKGASHPIDKSEKIDWRGIPSCEALERASTAAAPYPENPDSGGINYTAPSIAKADLESSSILDEINPADIFNGLIASAIWTVSGWLYLLFTRRRV